MSREELKEKIESWVRDISTLKTEIELTMTYIRNERIMINLSEAVTSLVKSYKMLLAAFKELNEG